jgi:hypothetical protein
MPKVRLKQLAQDGASNGQVVAFNTIAGEWEAQTAGGGAVWTVATETTAARSAADGEFVLVDASTCVITLPAPSPADARVAVKVIASTVTSIEIRTSGAGIDIDGTDYSAAGLKLKKQYEQISVVSDGTDWWIY